MSKIPKTAPAAAAPDAAAPAPAADDAAADAAMNADALAQASTDRAAGDLPPMTLAEACALVRIDPADALAFKDHGTHVVVVTAAGQKLTTAAAA